MLNGVQLKLNHFYDPSMNEMTSGNKIIKLIINEPIQPGYSTHSDTVYLLIYTVHQLQIYNLLNEENQINFIGYYSKFYSPNNTNTYFNSIFYKCIHQTELQ